MMDFLKPVRDWNRVRNTRAELNSLTNRELADLGITRGDIPSIARRSVALIERQTGTRGATPCSHPETASFPPRRRGSRPVRSSQRSGR